MPDAGPSIISSVISVELREAGKEEWSNELKYGTTFGTGRRAALRPKTERRPFLPTPMSHLTKSGLHLGSPLLHIPRMKALNH